MTFVLDLRTTVCFWRPVCQCAVVVKWLNPEVVTLSLIIAPGHHLDCLVESGVETMSCRSKLGMDLHFFRVILTPPRNRHHAPLRRWAHIVGELRFRA